MGYYNLLIIHKILKCLAFLLTKISDSIKMSAPVPVHEAHNHIQSHVHMT